MKKVHDVEFAKDLNIVLNECLPELEKIVNEGTAKFIGITGYLLQTLKECIKRANGRIDVSKVLLLGVQCAMGLTFKLKEKLNAHTVCYLHINLLL